MKFAISGILLLVCLVPIYSCAQDLPGSSTDQSGMADKIIHFPSKLFSKIQAKEASLDQQLTKQTEKYLQKMARREAKLKKKLYKVDSTAANNLFNESSAQQFAALGQRLKTDSVSGKNFALSGEYLPYIDSLKGSLSFLQQNPQLLGGAGCRTPIR